MRWKNKLRYVSSWKKKFKALVPRRAKYTFIARIIEFLLKHTSWLNGTEEPPRFMDFSGGSFLPLGDRLAELMVNRAGLAKGMRVLDVGCGIGRVAVALDKRFSDDIEYLGFDVVRFGIAWCRKRFSDHKTYRFVHADIYNGFYNPHGSAGATAYSFPCADKSIDFIFATSVYTHMGAPEVEHYLLETARCLTAQGRVYLTCFILDDESNAQINSSATLFSFRYSSDATLVESPSEPELAVAFRRTAFQAMAAKACLSVLAFYPGSWRGIGYEDFQDAYILGPST